jgi:hypothetical protein
MPAIIQQALAVCRAVYLQRQLERLCGSPREV